MKKMVKRWLLACPGFEAFCRRLTARHVRAIMYHRFSESRLQDPRFVDRVTLGHQACYLKRHHAIWDPDLHLRAIRGWRWSGWRCPVVITVDDGYADFATVAWPVFREYGLRVMFFVATDFVDGRNWFWWDKIEYVLDRAEPKDLEIEIGTSAIRINLCNSQGRKRSWHVIADLCRFLPDCEKESAIEDLARVLRVTLPKAPPTGYVPVDWQQIRSMASEGVLFGVHTKRHPILSRVSLEEAEDEISGSHERLVKMLGSPIQWFSYPQGGPADWTPSVRLLIEKRFRGCYLAYQELADPDDPYTMPRYGMSGDMIAFRWSMCGAEYLVLRLRKLLCLATGVGADYWPDHARLDDAMSSGSRGRKRGRPEREDGS